MIISEKTSRTIMVANLLAILMIIMIHYQTRFYALVDGTVVGWNYFTQEFLTNGLARAGVPYFALISGFFLYSQVAECRSYGTLLRRRLHTLLLPYMLASAIIFVSVAVEKLFKGSTALWDLKTFIYGITITPLSGQFWFLRDLCVLVVLSPLLLPKNRILQYVLGLCLFVPWLLEMQILPILGDCYIINIETLFFFYLGGQLSYRGQILETIINASTKLKTSVAALLLVVLLTRIWIDPTIDLWYGSVMDHTLFALLFYKATVVLGIICLIQISSRFIGNATLIYLSGLSFFAFLFHFVPLSFLLSRFLELFTAKEFEFYLSFPMAVVLVFVSGHLVAVRAPWLFGILCGGRNPNKALNRTGPQPAC